MGLFNFLYDKNPPIVKLDIHKQIQSIFAKDNFTYENIKLIINFIKKEKNLKGKDLFTLSCGHHGYMFDDFADKYYKMTNKKVIEDSLFACYLYENKSTTVNIYIPKINKKVAYIQYNKKKYYRFEFDKNLF